MSATCSIIRASKSHRSSSLKLLDIRGLASMKAVVER